MIIDKLKQFVGNLFDNDPEIRFACTKGAPHVSPLTRIELARSVMPEWIKDQKENNNTDKFLNCPGMSDYAKAGYIIPAWSDMEIKANRGGTVIKYNNNYNTQESNLNFKMVEPMVPINSSVRGLVIKVPCPWAIFAKPGWSGYLVPAYYHSPFLKDLFMYPGIIDFDTFHTINFVFTALHECELTIPAGTPLLQLIPFKREIVRGVCMKGTEDDKDRHIFSYPTLHRSAYRRLFHQKKTFKLEHK